MISAILGTLWIIAIWNSGLLVSFIQKPWVYQELEKEIEGDSMEPLLPRGSKVILQVWYYDHGKLPAHGDIIAYNYGGSRHPIIKTIRGIPGDKAEIDPVGKTLKINGEYLANSVGARYSFTSGELRMLGLYVKDGKIPDDGYFIFGDNVKYSADSRKFWAVSKNDFYGKFILKP